MTETALVTGAAGGIGEALVTKLLQRGHTVVATDLSLDRLGEVADRNGWAAAGGSVAALDVRDHEQWASVVQSVVSDHGRLDRCFNVAGYLWAGPFHEIPPPEIDLQVDVNLKGVMHGTQAATRQMLTQSGGPVPHIITIGSMASLAPVPGIAHYDSTKFGVRGFVLSARAELVAERIDLSLVYPDPVDTPMLDPQFESDAANVSFSSKKILTVDEVVGIIVDEVMVDRPLERAIPKGRGRLAKFGGTFPKISDRLGAAMAKSGERNKRRLLKERL